MLKMVKQLLSRPHKPPPQSKPSTEEVELRTTTKIISPLVASAKGTDFTRMRIMAVLVMGQSRVRHTIFEGSAHAKC